MLMLLISLVILMIPAQAQDDELLDPNQAFALSAAARDADTIVAKWAIAEGYYLYRHQFRFESLTPGIRLGEPRLPKGKVKEDEFFGKQETYRQEVTVEIPVERDPGAPDRLELETVSQGCTDLGICYPPQTQSVAVVLPVSEAAAEEAAEEELLDPDEAYVLSLTAPDADTVVASWDIAEGYYLYKSRFDLSVADGEGVSISALEIPAGEVKEDEFFGRQEVFHDRVTITARLQRDRPEVRDLTMQVTYQGCADAGVCYPPITKTVALTLPPLEAKVSEPAASAPEEPAEPELALEQPPAAAPAFDESEQGVIARMLIERRYLSLPAFFGFGLLLAFTPCIFPMVPILSSIIVGAGEDITRGKAFMLSLVYVLAMAVTYTVAGVLAASLGQNIQALFQNPWILVAFSVLFVLLALSMFGFYELQIPNSWQSKLTEVSNSQGGGTYTGVAVMGFLSALIVGPCVAAPLIGILTVIGTTGDLVLGGVALFILSLGMGAPLLVVGAAGGHLLPRAGHWMDATKAVFGVVLIGVAIWMLERIIPAAAAMLLWATLLIVSAVFMGALRPVEKDGSGWQHFFKGLGLVLLLYGFLQLVGVAAGGKDTIQPLRGVILADVGPTGGEITAREEAKFRKIKTLDDLQQAIAQAGGRPVMLDFYADWCVSCKEMEKYTFPDPGVVATWAKHDTVLLKADVTANDEVDKALMRHFGIFGPPAYLFFGPDGEERRGYRVVGFMEADKFQEHLEKALRPTS